VRFNKKTNAENFYRERLLLFYLWRDEGKDLKGNHETYKAMYKIIQALGLFEYRLIMFSASISVESGDIFCNVDVSFSRKLL
jgi:hypothetical protein